jgi:hypothetical protein
MTTIEMASTEMMIIGMTTVGMATTDRSMQ